MKSHTGMEAHDGYAPHSHEVRADHLGVGYEPGTSSNAVLAKDVTWKLDATVRYIGVRPIRESARDGAELTWTLDNGQRFRVSVTELERRE